MRANQVFNNWQITCFAAALTGLIYALVPTANEFLKRLPIVYADYVSVTLLKQQTQLYPDHTPNHLELTRHLYQVGEFQEAQNYLASYQQAYRRDPILYQRYLFMNTVLQGERAFEAETEEERELLTEAVLEAIATTDLDALNAWELEALSKYALGLGAPGYGADIFFELAREDPSQTLHWLEQAARWYQAAEEYPYAAAAFTAATEQSPTVTQQLAYAYQGAHMHVMAGDYELAAALTDRYFTGEPVAVARGSLVKAELALLDQQPMLASRLIDQFAVAHQAQADKTANLEKAIALALAVQKTDLALRWAELNHQYHPNLPWNRRYLARLLSWYQRPVESLKHWLWLVDHDQDPEAIAQAWQIAGGLFHYDLQIKVLSTVAAKRALADNEITALTNAYEERGDPEAGIAFLKTYTNKYPLQYTGWQLLLTLYRNIEQFGEIDRLWQQINRLEAVDIASAVNIANIFWAIGKPGKALAMLQALRSKAAQQREQRIEYWELLAMLTWRSGNAEGTLDILWWMRDSGLPLTAVSADLLLGILTDNNPAEARLQVASQAWQDLEHPRYLFQALSLGLALQDWATLENLLHNVPDLKALEGFSEYWLYRGLFNEQLGRFAFAHHDYQRALLAPDMNIAIVPTYFWFLINHGDRESLRQALRIWQAQAQVTSALWSVYAAGYQAIGEYQQALFWQDRLLSENPNDINLLVASAANLSEVGQPDRVERIREWALLLMMEQLHDNPDYQPVPAVMAGLIATQHGTRDSFRYLRTQSVAQQPALLYTLGVDWFLSQGNVDAAVYTHARQPHAKTPSPQEEARRTALLLAQAGAEHDAYTLQTMLDNGDVPTTARPSINAQLGYPGLALTDSLALIEAPDLPNAGDAARDLAASLRSAYPAGFQLAHVRNEARDSGRVTETSRLTVAQPWHEQFFRLDLAKRQHDAGSDLKLLGAEEEYTAQLTWTHPDDAGDLLVSGIFSQRTDADLYGFSLTKNWRLDSRISGASQLQWQQPADASDTLRFLARQQRIGSNLNIRLTGRDNVSVLSSATQLEDRQAGEAIGHYFSFTLQYQHTVIAADPQISIRGGVSTQNSMAAAHLSPYLQDRLIDPETGNSAVLPQSDRRWFGGFSISRGVLGNIAADRAYPRYLLDAEYSVQEQQQISSWSVRLGLGVPILGDDELSLQLGYSGNASGTVTGSTGITTAVTYSFAL